MELEKIRPSFSDAQVSTAVVEFAHKSLKQNSDWQSIKGF